MNYTIKIIMLDIKQEKIIYDILKKNFSDIIFYDFYHYKLHSDRKIESKRVFLRILKLGT